MKRKKIKALELITLATYVLFFTAMNVYAIINRRTGLAYNLANALYVAFPTLFIMINRILRREI